MPTDRTLSHAALLTCTLCAGSSLTAGCGAPPDGTPVLGAASSAVTVTAAVRAGSAASPGPVVVTTLSGWAPPDKDKQDAEARAPRAAASDRKSAARARLDALAADQKVSVTLVLAEPAFDWDAYRAADPAARATHLRGRVASQRAAQAGVRAALAARGVSDIEDYAAVNHLRVDLLPGAARALLDQPDVIDVQTAAATLPLAAYTGVESTNGTLLSTFYNAGYTGAVGHTASAPVRFALIESNAGTVFNPSHVGWKRSGVSRVVSTRNCGVSGCPTVTTSSSGPDHATEVGWVAAGSIQAGQDAAYPGSNTTAQRARSGHAAAPSIYFYADGGNSDGVKRAIDRAIADGADVINLSLGIGGNCDATANWSGINGALQSAQNAGIVTLAAAGNSGNSGGCTIGYPGLRPENLAVAALNSTNSASVYTSLGIASYSSRGGVPIRRFDGLSITTAGVDIAAPGDFTDNFTNGTNTYGSSTISGTSFATPVLSGAAISLRHAFQALGWSYTNSRALMVNLLMYGDAWDAVSGGTVQRLSEVSGAGRLRARFPSSASLTAPWGWGWHSFTIAQGQTVTWPVWDTGPESTALTEWKWAALWDEPDLQNVADIDFYVYNTCPSGGGAPVLVASDVGYSLRTHMRLSQSQIGGRCLEMRAYGYKVPAAGRTVYTADFFHSSTP